MGNTKWKKMADNAINPKRTKEEELNIRRKLFKQTMQIDKMPVNKVKSHNLPKRSHDPENEANL